MFSNTLKALSKRCYSIKNITRKYTIYTKYGRNITKHNVNFLPRSVNTTDQNCFKVLSTGLLNSRYSSSKSDVDDLNVPSSDTTRDDDFYNVDEAAITDGDPDKLKQLKILMLEVEVVRQEGLNVPSKITTDQWKELLTCNSRSQKLRCLRFWFVNECKKINDKIKKEKKRIERDEKLKELIAQTDPNHIRYGLGGNTMFLRISEATMNNLANNRLVLAMKFGQNLVIDCSYDNYMTKKEQSLCAKQLLILFAANRNHDDPFNIHFCNINGKGHLMNKLFRSIPTMYNDDFPMNMHEEHYLNMFPKERLVYLTPHCRTELNTFSHDDVYILGGIVDRVNCEPLSLAKAKSEGLRMAKFPLDKYLMWAMGSKSLTLDQCLAILLEVKKSGDWTKAFDHVPKRKLFQQPTDTELEEIENERDKSGFYGQTYVSTHEWGLNKSRMNNRKFIKPPPVYDLRQRLVTLKKKS